MLRISLRKKIEVLLFSLVIVFILPFSLQAAGLAVDPGRILVTDVPSGTEVAVSSFPGGSKGLLIRNKSDEAYRYQITILPVSKTSASLLATYQELPDVSWVRPESDEVRVDAGGAKAVELLINIPAARKFSGKRYQAIIEVKSLKNDPKDLFVLAAQIQILIHIKPQAKRKKWFFGLF